MKPSTIEVWLWLLLVMCPYNRKTTELLEHFDSAEELACAIRDGNCPGLSEAEKQRARNIRSREVGQIMQECAQNDIRIITLDDPEYPTLLKNIYSPPIVLFVRGSLMCLENEVSLAVVGPRHPSDYARRAARMLCSDLARLGTVLVSGLAVGDRRRSALLRCGAWNSHHRSSRLRSARELPRRERGTEAPYR